MREKKKYVASKIITLQKNFYQNKEKKKNHSGCNFSEKI